MDFTRVRLFWQPGNSTSLLKHTHLDFQEDGAEPDASELLLMAEAAQGSSRAGVLTWATIAASGYPLVHCSAQNMHDEATPPTPSYPYDKKWAPTSIEVQSTTAVAAASVSTSLPPAVSQLVSLKSLTPGRRASGRVYLPGGAEADCDASGAISAGDAAANAAFITQVATAILAQMTLGTWIIASIPGTTASPRPATAPAAFEVVTTVGRLHVATQRRRQDYG